MHLISLSLENFRSFGQATLVSFDQAFHCFVGPNGCGKSNLLEACLWGLGMVDGSPEELLFRGTKSRELAVHLNVGLVVALDSGEKVSIERLLKSGRTEQLVNGVPATEAREFLDYLHSMVRVVSDPAEIRQGVNDGWSSLVVIGDEIDQEFGDSSTAEFAADLNTLKQRNQVILASHSRTIMNEADGMTGVTCQEYGLSSLIGMRL